MEYWSNHYVYYKIPLTKAQRSRRTQIINKPSILINYEFFQFYFVPFVELRAFVRDDLDLSQRFP